LNIKLKEGSRSSATAAERVSTVFLPQKHRGRRGRIFFAFLCGFAVQFYFFQELKKREGIFFNAKTQRAQRYKFLLLALGRFFGRSTLFGFKIENCKMIFEYKIKRR
jgi:hypothetical protein